MKNWISTFLILISVTFYAGAQCTGFFADFSDNAPKCEGEAVDFVNTGSSYAGLVYSWSFGSGAAPSNSSMENPTGVVYSTPGLKSVTLTIADTALGCVASATHGVTIHDEPAVSFTSNTPNCENYAVNFTNTGSTGGTWTYTWDFGVDALPSGSSAENPTGVSYSSPGTKTVTFTISNANCSATQVSNITINPTPVAGFTSTAPQCTGNNVDFTNTGTTGATYAWDLGSGATPATSTVENPAGVVYSTAGTKTVTLITSLGACSDTSVQTININLTPTVTFTSTAPQCGEAPVDFSNTGTTGLGWTFDWDFGANASPATSTNENPVGVIYTAGGTKTVTLTISDANCAASTTNTITINPKPVADFTSTAPQCTGDAVDFTNTGSTGATYSWDLGTDATPATSTMENPAGVTYSTPGTKVVTLIATLGSCSDTSTQTINVNLTPTVTFTSTAPQCGEAAVDFTNTGSTGANWTFAWDFGADAAPATSTNENPAGVIYTNFGTKTVTLTVSDMFCSAADTNTIVIEEKPVAGFSSDAPKCTGDTVAFTNTGTTGATYSWDLGAGATPATSTDENPSGVIYSTPGTKTITQIVTLGNCSDTSVQTINIGLTPTVTFTTTAPQCGEAAVDFTNTGTNGLGWSFDWDLGNDAVPSTSTAENPDDVIYTSSGDKVITLTISNTVCSATATDTINIEEKPVASFTSDAPQCTGDTVAFLNTGTPDSLGATFFWYFGPDAVPDISTLENPSGVIYSQPGTKTVYLITTLGNCSDTTFRTFTINLTPAVSFTSTAPQCAGTTVDFTNTGDTGPNWSYFWDLGAEAVPAISTSENPEDVVYDLGGNKLVTLTISDNFCTNTDSATIFIDFAPVTDAGADTTICANRCTEIGSADIAGNSYQWFPTSTLDDPTVSNPVSCPTAAINEYFVTVTDDATGCTKVDSIIVTMLPPVVSDAGIDVEICFGDSIQIGAALVEGQTYTWTPAAGLSDAMAPSPIAKPDTTTLYTLVASYEGCEVVADEVLVTVNPLPPANATDDLGRDSLAIARGEWVQLIGTGGIQYVWTPEEGLNNPGIFNPVATPDTSTVYTVTVTDLNFCVNSDSVIVTVLEPQIFIPTAFTPNNDGHNDIFYVRNIGLVDFEFDIFDRNGSRIFHTSEGVQGWDGRNAGNNSKLPEGAYVYFVKGVLSDGEEFTQRGIINLIR